MRPQTLEGGNGQMNKANHIKAILATFLDLDEAAQLEYIDKLKRIKESKRQVQEAQKTDSTQIAHLKYNK